jgi:AraC-like DNA-binding protein
MEVLSDILRSMRVRGSVYFCDHLNAPWSMDFVATKSASFHLVRAGECWITSGGASERLGPGDLVFIEAGREHVLSSQPPGGPERRDGAGTLLLCGYCDLGENTGTPLLNVFPSLTVLRADELARHPWLSGTLEQLSSEYRSRQPGSELVVDKLTEVVLIELIRINFGRPGTGEFLNALADRQISRALGQLHNNLHVGWTIGGLASKIGMSRAAFARRFRDLVGQPMFEYLTALRMQRARELLRETRLPVYEIAGRVGYESDMAFARTFRKHTGVTPARYRKG